MLKNIAPDLPVEEARTLAVTQRRLAGAAFQQAVAVAAWKTKPCWFIVTTEDRVVSAELQTPEAKRMDAKVNRATCHCSHIRSKSLLSSKTLPPR